MRYGTLIIDPPWNYERASTHKKLTGYSSTEYEPLTTDDLRRLPIGDLVAPDGVVLLWTTSPFLPDALSCLEAWGLQYISALYWVKADTHKLPLDGELEFTPNYGVGYWMRGCVEPILLAKPVGGRSYRGQFVGLISPNARHSRKPENIYEFAEQFPAPRLELFARRRRDGWTTLGDGIDGRDIRATLEATT